MGIAAGKCTSTARLDGKVAIVTGCNTGIGQYTAQDLYKRGCRVIMACRNEKKAVQAKLDILERTKGAPNVGELVFSQLDLTSLKSVRKFAEHTLQTESHIHILINNAGIASTCSYTDDGFEIHFQTNHLSHFLLTLLLLPKLVASAPARIVNVASIAHWIAPTINWDDLQSTVRSYTHTKTLNILFACELAKRLEGTGVTAYSVNPGFVRTDIARNADNILIPGSTWFLKHLIGFIWKTLKSGAQTTIYCAVDEQLSDESGLYYSDCMPAACAEQATNPENSRKLWESSLKLLKMEDFDPLKPI